MSSEEKMSLGLVGLLVLTFISIGTDFILRRKANDINTDQQISRFECLLHKHCENKIAWNDRANDIQSAYNVMKASEDKYFLIMSGQFDPWIYSTSISINSIIVMDEVMSDGTAIRRPGATLKSVQCKNNESYTSCALAVSKMAKNI